MPRPVSETDAILADLAAALDHTLQVRSYIAEQITSIGSYLHCNKCGQTQGLTKEQAIGYLAHGWPTHCGMTMELRR